MNDFEIVRKCSYCGNYHVGVCPRVASMEYFPNGMLKRIEFHQVAGLRWAPPVEAGHLVPLPREETNAV